MKIKIYTEFGSRAVEVNNTNELQDLAAKYQRWEYISEPGGDKVSTLGLVIGHSKNSPGAINREVGINEYELNQELAKAITVECDKRYIKNQIIYRKNGYGKLPADINSTKVSYCMCIHHNGAGDKTINGNETLYYHKSKISQKFARYVNNEMYNCLQIRNRDTKAVDSEDRGGYVLKYTAMSCILLEPYFMTNNKAVQNRDTKKLASAIVDGYEKFLNKKEPTYE